MDCPVTPDVDEVRKYGDVHMALPTELKTRLTKELVMPWPARSCW